MDHDSYDNAYISGILQSVKTIAVVGASANDVRPSFFVMKYMLDKGYQVIPVNPGQAGKPRLGQITYARLSDIPVAIDMVDIFRASDAVPGIVDEALALDPLPKVVWPTTVPRSPSWTAAATISEALAVYSLTSTTSGTSVSTSSCASKTSSGELRPLVETTTPSRKTLLTSTASESRPPPL